MLKGVVITGSVLVKFFHQALPPKEKKDDSSFTKSKETKTQTDIVEDDGYLSASTRSVGDSPLGSSFVLGNKINGIPFSLANSAPPHPVMKERIQ